CSTMRASRSVYAGLFCVAASVLILEVALTRVLSVLLWGHYSFLVISTALLGFGAAGSWLTVARARNPQSVDLAALPRGCMMSPRTPPASVMIVSRLGFEPTLIFVSVSSALMLTVVYLLLAVPFFFAGLVIGRVVSGFSGQIASIYFSDLAGAGTGALVVTF